MPIFRLDPKQAVADHVANAGSTSDVTLSPLAEQIVRTPIPRTYVSAVIVGLAQAIEALLLIALGLALFAITDTSNPVLHVLAAFGVVVMANIGLNFAHAHGIAAYRGLQQLGQVAVVWTLLFAALFAVALLIDPTQSLSRAWIGYWFIAGLALLLVYRVALRALVKHWTAAGKLKRRTVIIGGGKNAEPLIEAIRKGAADDINVLGIFDDRNDDRSPESVAHIPKLGKVADLIEFARRTRVDLVIVSMPLSAEKRVLEMLRQLWVLPVDIRLSAHMSALKFRPQAYSYVGNVPVFDMADRPITDWNRVFKWLFDKVVAITALILLSPIMIATAIAIKLESKGPVLFKQKRHGFNNKLIEMYKFRSMYTDMADVGAAKLVTKDDPRVTRVGRFIRKTSIDELPQLFNVLRGELSIVGPRPHALQAKADNQLYYEAVEGYFARHRVKPGMTGWAQINGWRGETDTVDKIMQRVDHDLYYIENWSLWFDLKIVALTPLSLFTQRKNAF